MTADPNAVKLPAPENLRELFRLFSKYDAAQGLASLISRIDFGTVNPRQVYYCVHGRAPERLRAIMVQPGYSAEKHFVAAITSAEFQARVIWHFLNAFPEKRRLLFVHVPKCAGSDLSHHLASRFLTLPHRLTSDAWVARTELFETLRQLVLGVEDASALFVHGHIELERYLSAVPVRFGDRIFTIIRDPVEIAISQANYAVTLLVRDPEGTRPDSRRNLELLGLDRLPENPSHELLNSLAIRAFFDRRITRPNLICQHLAGGRRGHRDAIRNIVLHDVEVTDTNHYNAWLHQAWGIESETRVNTSMKFLSREDIAQHADQVRELTAEDQKIFDLITWALAERGSPSVRGLDLLAMVSKSGRYAFDVEMDAIVAPEGREEASPPDPAPVEPLAVAEAKVGSAPTPSQTAPPAEPMPVEPMRAAAQPEAAAARPAQEAEPAQAGEAPAEPEPELKRHELMMRFESLGENCEFGLVQRRCGAEPLGLFRFASAPLPKLLAAVEGRFEGFGAPEKLGVELSSNGREYMVRDDQYGFLYHAWVMADEMRPEEIREREVRRLPLLIRKLVEDLTAARKLLVIRGMDQPLEQEQVERLLAAVHQYGPNMLLWVELADAEHPPGSVGWAAPDLLKGYIDRFAPGEHAHDLSLDCWVAICRQAERLWRQGQGQEDQDTRARTVAAAE
ncbi:MAG TPA: hypothetical protein VHU15_08020 [Stellaceae bacterium]|jgi:hypothetical protein|nr:hypothetical protein [Stellaceae bacterium]